MPAASRRGFRPMARCWPAGRRTAVRSRRTRCRRAPRRAPRRRRIGHTDSGAALDQRSGGDQQRCAGEYQTDKNNELAKSGDKHDRDRPVLMSFDKIEQMPGEIFHKLRRGLVRFPLYADRPPAAQRRRRRLRDPTVRSPAELRSSSTHQARVDAPRSRATGVRSRRGRSPRLPARCRRRPRTRRATTPAAQDRERALAQDHLAAGAGGDAARGRLIGARAAIRRWLRPKGGGGHRLALAAVGAGPDRVVHALERDEPAAGIDPRRRLP